MVFSQLHACNCFFVNGLLDALMKAIARAYTISFFLVRYRASDKEYCYLKSESRRALKKFLSLDSVYALVGMIVSYIEDDKLLRCHQF